MPGNLLLLWVHEPRWLMLALRRKCRVKAIGGARFDVGGLYLMAKGSIARSEHILIMEHGIRGQVFWSRRLTNLHVAEDLAWKLLSSCSATEKFAGSLYSRKFLDLTRLRSKKLAGHIRLHRGWRFECFGARFLGSR